MQMLRNARPAGLLPGDGPAAETARIPTPFPPMRILLLACLAWTTACTAQQVTPATATIAPGSQPAGTANTADTAGTRDPASPARHATVAPATLFKGDALALAQALDRHDDATVKRLIAAGTDPDTIFSPDAMPLLAYPMVNGNLAGLKLLLDNGANPNARRAPAGPGTVPPDSAMVYAAGEEDPRYLEALLSHGGDPNTIGRGNDTLLYTAHVKQRWKNVQLLVERGADTKAGRYMGYDNVAAWYSGLGDFDKVYWLLEHGVDPTGTTQTAAMYGGGTRMPIVEEIYWLPVKPAMKAWQEKCQALLAQRGIAKPPLHRIMRERREALGVRNQE